MVDLVVPGPGGDIVEEIQAIAPPAICSLQAPLVADAHGVADGLPEDAVGAPLHVVEGPPLVQAREPRRLRHEHRQRVQQVAVADVPAALVPRVQVVHAGEGAEGARRRGRVA